MKMYKNVAKNVPKEVELCEGAFFSRLNVYFLIRSQFQINHSVGRVLYFTACTVHFQTLKQDGGRNDSELKKRTRKENYALRQLTQSAAKYSINENRLRLLRCTLNCSRGDFLVCQNVTLPI